MLNIQLNWILNLNFNLVSSRFLTASGFNSLASSSWRLFPGYHPIATNFKVEVLKAALQIPTRSWECFHLLQLYLQVESHCRRAEGPGATSSLLSLRVQLQVEVTWLRAATPADFNFEVQVGTSHLSASSSSSSTILTVQMIQPESDRLRLRLSNRIDY